MTIDQLIAEKKRYEDLSKSEHGTQSDINNAERIGRRIRELKGDSK